mmetsp:Transcript_4049/g.8337  ORF Transcript_4049/g.8337 Transcript_4049/m.8337 type:complete len:210 (-) Transcript_4049:651-1280(-)
MWAYTCLATAALLLCGASSFTFEGGRSRHYASVNVGRRAMPPARPSRVYQYGGEQEDYTNYSQQDKNAEIAALEERLRLLREEEMYAQQQQQQQQQQQSIGNENEAIVSMDAQEQELEERLRWLKSQENYNDSTEESVMFSESWKDARSGYEAAQQEKTIDTFKSAGLVVAAIIGLGLFSQVPIGQEDLQKYQDVKGNTSRIDLGDLNH